MNRVEFLNVFKLLNDKEQGAYPGRYTPGKMEAVWRLVSRSTAEAFRQACLKLAETVMVPPAPFEIAAATSNAEMEIRIRAKENLTDEQKAQRCKYCGETGIMTCLKNSAPYEQSYAFRCAYCNSADIRCVSRYIPSWSREVASQYTVLNSDSGTPIPKKQKHLSVVTTPQSDLEVF